MVVSLDNVLSGEETIQETTKEIRGEKVRFLEGIPEDAELTMSLHIRNDIWDSVVFAFAKELGYLPHYKGMEFETACGYLGRIMNTTRCWVEDYKGIRTTGKKPTKADVPLENLCARLKHCAKQVKEGKTPITRENFYAALRQAEAGEQTRFEINEEIQNPENISETIIRTSKIPIHHTSSQHILLQDRITKEAELIRKVSYNEITQAYLHAKGEIKRHLGYNFEESVSQHGHMIDATYYLIEQILESQESAKSKTKLIKLQQQKLEEKRMILTMSVDIGVSRRERDFNALEEMYAALEKMIESPKQGQQIPQFFTETVNGYKRTLNETASLVEFPLENAGAKSELEQIQLERMKRDKRLEEMENYFTTNMWRLS